MRRIGYVHRQDAGGTVGNDGQVTPHRHPVGGPERGDAVHNPGRARGRDINDLEARRTIGDIGVIPRHHQIHGIAGCIYRSDQHRCERVGHG